MRGNIRSAHHQFVHAWEAAHEGSFEEFDLGQSGNGVLGSPLCFTRCILRGCLLGGLAVIFASAPMLAQSTTADVVGTVTDISGAVVPNAKVELTSVETHETRTVTSGSDGEYAFTLLKPNHYSLRVTAPGFKVFTIQSFSLSAGDRAREDSNL